MENNVTEKSDSKHCSLAELSKLVLTPDSRISHPLVVNGFIWLTDGRVLLELDVRAWGAPELPFWMDEQDRWIKHGDISGSPIKRSSIAGVLEIAKGELSIEIPSVEGPPPEANERWEVDEECSFCAGNGWNECSMGHQHECDQCCGAGIDVDFCEEANERIPIGERDFARHYVWLINQLPGCVGVNLTPTGSLGFKFEGGRGVLQSMQVR